MHSDTATVEQPLTFALYSKLAFYPMHLEAFRYICEHYAVRGVILADHPPEMPLVHRQLGWADLTTSNDPFAVRIAPALPSPMRRVWLQRELWKLRPDAIWVQEEPVDSFLQQILLSYRFNRRTRIVSAVCENIFPLAHGPRKAIYEMLWPRLDGLLAVASLSAEGIQAAGMPVSVPVTALVAGGLPPPENLDPLPLMLRRSDNDFIVGFAGRICEEKGWHVLANALLLLPESVKCLIAGDGPQVDKLRTWIRHHRMDERVVYVGLLAKALLWRYYRSLDCLVVPSLTRPHWKEQFGGVLADAMAVGLPMIGSSSGAIPEVIGPAGMIVPEGDAEALARAITYLQAHPEAHRAFGMAGRQRFEDEFNIPAYARKIAASLRLPPRSISRG